MKTRVTYLIAMLGTLLLVAASCGSRRAKSDGVIYDSEQLTVTTDSVVAGETVAKALSATEIVVNRPITVDSIANRAIVQFSFAINGRDNESGFGRKHSVIIDQGTADTTECTWGSVTNEATVIPAADTIARNTRWTISLDMKPVLRSFARNGYFVAAGGDTIYAEDFKGVWLAGNVAPLVNDFNILPGLDEMKLKPGADSVYSVTVTLNQRPRPLPSRWSVDTLPSRRPTYHSGQLIVDALYNRGVDLLGNGYSPDMPTLDLAYSIYLSGALLDTKSAIKALRSRVTNQLIADSSWPLHTSRTAWALAAWEVYKLNGDRNWLREAAAVIENTLRRDASVSLDHRYNLMRGAGRCATPSWMTPVDRYMTFDMETNVVTALAWETLAHMASELDHSDAAVAYRAISSRLREAINDYMWMPELGRYSSFLYGGFYPIPAPTVSHAAQSLAVMADIASPEMAVALTSRTPHSGPTSSTDLAMECIAAAKSLNTAAFSQSFGRLIGQSAMLDDTTSFCAVPAVALRVMMGINVDADGLTFKPIVPKFMPGDKVVKGLRYRRSTLDITVRGTGSTVASLTLDGTNFNGKLPVDMTGLHKIVITMAGNSFPESTVATADSMPPVPTVDWRPPTALITDFSDTLTYRVYLDGTYSDDIDRPDYTLNSATRRFTTINLVPASKSTKASGFSASTMLYFPQGSPLIIQPEINDSTGTPLIVDHDIASQFVQLGPVRNNRFDIEVVAPADGTYFIDLRYANGTDAVALRQLSVNNHPTGFFVMPPVRAGEWHPTAFSSFLTIRLKQGLNTLTIDNPTSTDIVLLDYIRLIPTT